MDDEQPQLNVPAPPARVVEPYKPPMDEVNYFASANFRGESKKFGIKLDDRRRHMYVIGKTGMGKSTMLENMIIQDMQSGKGMAVVDPHGDLVEKVVDFIPSDRINDVVYFNPSDLDHPIAFNILEQVGPEYKNLVANGLVGVFKKIWADSWGPRLEYILINSILSLLEYPGSTLLGVTRMLVDAKYRKKVVKNISDPVVKQFWIEEFNNYSEKFRNEAIAPIQNKVGQFLSSSLIRNIVGQSKSTIDMREIMDGGKILLMNLSKGRIGEENASLLGAMMITKIQLAAMSRVDIPEETRRDFFLYVDEFQNFATESFANILSEARKYRLNLIMAHQYIEQLSDEVRAAVFGNVGTTVCFRVGAIDAFELEKEFQPTFLQEHIVSLPSFQVYLRLMIDGIASEPFSATTLPPIAGHTGHGKKVIAVSRERYSGVRSDVEERINKWSGHTDESGETDDDDDTPAPAKKPTSNDRKPSSSGRDNAGRRDDKGGRERGGRDNKSSRDNNGGRDSAGGRDNKPRTEKSAPVKKQPEPEVPSPTVDTTPRTQATPPLSAILQRAESQQQASALPVSPAPTPAPSVAPPQPVVAPAPPVVSSTKVNFVQSAAEDSLPIKPTRAPIESKEEFSSLADALPSTPQSTTSSAPSVERKRERPQESKQEHIEKPQSDSSGRQGGGGRSTTSQGTSSSSKKRKRRRRGGGASGGSSHTGQSPSQSSSTTASTSSSRTHQQQSSKIGSPKSLQPGASVHIDS